MTRYGKAGVLVLGVMFLTAEPVALWAQESSAPPTGKSGSSRKLPSGRSRVAPPPQAPKVAPQQVPTQPDVFPKGKRRRRLRLSRAVSRTQQLLQVPGPTCRQRSLISGRYQDGLDQLRNYLTMIFPRKSPRRLRYPWRHRFRLRFHHLVRGIPHPILLRGRRSFPFVTKALRRLPLHSRRIWSFNGDCRPDAAARPSRSHKVKPRWRKVRFQPKLSLMNINAATSSRFEIDGEFCTEEISSTRTLKIF